MRAFACCLLLLLIGCSNSHPADPLTGREATSLPPITFDITGVSVNNEPGVDYRQIDLMLAHFSTTLRPDPTAHPVTNPANFQVLSDAVYMPDGVTQNEKCLLDLWIAPGAEFAPTPLLIFYHGGGFSGGDKTINDFTLRQLLSQNFSVAAVDYRLTQQGLFPFPVAMWDSSWGLKALRAYVQATGANIDTDRIGCWGGSAGAGLSLWLGYHADLQQQYLLSKLDPGESSETVLGRTVQLGDVQLSAKAITVQSTRIHSAFVTQAQAFYDLSWGDEAFFSDFAPDAMVPFYGLTNYVAIDQLREPWPESPSGFVFLNSKINTAFRGHPQWSPIRRDMRESSPLKHLTPATAIPTMMVYSSANTDLSIIGTPPPGWTHPWAPPRIGPVADGVFIHNIRHGYILKRRFQDLGIGSMIQLYENIDG